MPIINAEDRFNAAHPSTTPQVRLASWWFTRHAEKIAEIEAANDPKQNKSIELLMVGDSITKGFACTGHGSWASGYVKILRDLLGDEKYDVWWKCNRDRVEQS